MTKYETETTITYNDEEPEATIYTCNKALIKRLDNLCRLSPKVTGVRQDEYSKTYKIIKKAIKVVLPREYTDEKREKMAQAFKDRLAKSKT